MASHPLREAVDPRPVTEVGPLEPAEVRVELGLPGGEQLPLEDDAVMPRAHQANRTTADSRRLGARGSRRAERPGRGRGGPGVIEPSHWARVAPL